MLWLLVLGLFGQTLAYPFLEWDDRSFILQSPVITTPFQVPLWHHLLTPHFTYIAPVTIGVETLLYAIGGGRAWPFHLLGVLLHGLIASTFFWLCLRLAMDRWVAFVGAVFFVVHPIVAEPVSWSTGLKDQIMATFVVSATLFFVSRVQKTMAQDDPSQSPWSLWLLPFFLGLCAVLSKPSAGLLGGVWLVWLFGLKMLQGRDTPKQAWLVSALFVILGVALAFASNWMRVHMLGLVPAKIQRGQWDVLLALGHQTLQLLWPFSLHPSYPLVRTADFADNRTWVGLVTLLGIICGTGLLLWHRATRALFGLAWCVAIYVPVSQLIAFPRFVCDSYLYAPLMGAILFVGSLLSVPVQRWREADQTKPLRLLGVVACVLLLPLTAISAVQATRWSSDIHLWTPTAREYPRWYYPWINIAQGHQLAKRPRLALKAYKRAFVLDTPTQFLSSLARSLLQNRKWREAECVMLADITGGTKPQRAWRNYALFLIYLPGYKPSYPAWAQRALKGQLQKGRLSHKRRAMMQHRLKQLHQAFPTTHTQTKSFSIKHCKNLRHAHSK